MNLEIVDKMIKLHELVSEAGIGYIEADTSLYITSWNKGAGEIFDLTEDQAMGQPLDEVLLISKQRFLQCIETESCRFNHINQFDEKLQCEAYLSPILNPEDEKTGVAVLVKDITGQDENEKLRYEQQFVQDIFGFSPIGIFHVNMDGKMVKANPELAWMLGFESGDSLMNHVTDFASQLFYDKKRSDEFMYAIFETEQVMRFRCRLKRKDNSFIWTMCYAKATLDEFNRMYGFNGFAIDISETIRAEQQLKKANEKLKMLSVIDGLTGIANRRRFDEYLNQEWRRQFRDKQYLSIIMCDIDYFKFYNDTYGHQAGDDCLKKVAGAIKSCVHRSVDLATRYGGEEFAIILPDSDPAGAMAVAEMIRIAVQDLAIPHKKSKVDRNVTLSLGVASLVPGKVNKFQDLVALADQALYEAKENGRNQCIQDKAGKIR